MPFKSKHPTQRVAQKRPPRRPDPAPWPPEGFVTVEQLMAALGNVAPQTVYNRIAEGLLPELVAIGTGRVGLPVHVARKALAELPSKAAALREEKRRAKVAMQRRAVPA